MSVVAHATLTHTVALLNTAAAAVVVVVVVVVAVAVIMNYKNPE